MEINKFFNEVNPLEWETTESKENRDFGKNDMIRFAKMYAEAIKHSQCCVNHESKEAQALDVAQSKGEAFNIEVSQLACKCPICSKEMDSQWVNHHHCTKCNEHFTTS